MRLELSDEAAAFGRVVHEAIAAAGGDEILRHTKAEPGIGDTLVGDVLAPLGVWDLDARSGATELEAAAAVCRGVGWWAAPGTVPERLARPRDLGSDALCVVSGPRPLAPVAGSSLAWTAVDLDGRRGNVTAVEARPTGSQAAGLAEVDLVPIDRGGAEDAVLGLVLPCWALLGMLDRALALTVDYVKERQQFGKPLAAFQAVQFQLTEAEVERAGVEVLAKYALWSLAVEPQQALVDALVLRLAAISAADTVFRICHQLHGAFGFCDEATLSWVSRASLTIRRAPLSLSGARTALARVAGTGGLKGLYSPRAAVS